MTSGSQLFQIVIAILRSVVAPRSKTLCLSIGSWSTVNSSRDCFFFFFLVFNLYPGTFFVFISFVFSLRNFFFLTFIEVFFFSIHRYVILVFQ